MWILFGFEELPDFVQQRMEMLENNHTRAYPPVYKGTLAQAMEERDVDAYLDSRKLNIDCKKAIEEAIALKFDGLHLEEDAATQVLEQFGEERMTFVMAIRSGNFLMTADFPGRTKNMAEHYRNPGKYQSGEESESGLCDRKPSSSVDGLLIWQGQRSGCRRLNRR